MIHKAADARGKRIAHSLQSNMIGYHKRWNTIIAEMFGNSVGTSMDFPNLYRKARHGTPAQYTALWSRNVRDAREAGIQVDVIAIPNKATLQVGAERFYTYFVDELGITDFQINNSLNSNTSNRLISPRPFVWPKGSSGEVTIGTVARKICGQSNSLWGSTPRSGRAFESLSRPRMCGRSTHLSQVISPWRRRSRIDPGDLRALQAEPCHQPLLVEEDRVDIVSGCRGREGSSLASV